MIGTRKVLFFVAIRLSEEEERGQQGKDGSCSANVERNSSVGVLCSAATSGSRWAAGTIGGGGSRSGEGSRVDGGSGGDRDGSGADFDSEVVGLRRRWNRACCRQRIASSSWG
ncbi:hypothetical protein PM082_012795 [Marasmius tenuissimus]|nr:hypothetical protein PM082_012795 [Marasmius tenuissimus]